LGATPSKITESITCYLKQITGITPFKLAGPLL